MKTQIWVFIWLAQMLRATLLFGKKKKPHRTLDVMANNQASRVRRGLLSNGNDPNQIRTFQLLDVGYQWSRSKSFFFLGQTFEFDLTVEIYFFSNPKVKKTQWLKFKSSCQNNNINFCVLKFGQQSGWLVWFVWFFNFCRNLNLVKLKHLYIKLI